MPQWFFISVLFVFGLLFGSFANVVIWRFPRGESLSQPGSHCPRCETPIAWYDNVPVLSWLVLRAKCRACGQPISARYPAVEALSGVLWAAAGVRFGISIQTAAAIAFFYLLMILSFIDLDTRRLPNALVGLLGGIGACGALVSQVAGLACVPLLPAGGLLSSPLAAAASGAVAAAGVPLVIALAYERLRGREGFGMGDVKLLAVMGVFLGLYALMAFFIGSVMGVVFGVSKGGSDGGFKFPFGPFLAAASVLATFVGPYVWTWYAGITGLA